MGDSMMAVSSVSRGATVAVAFAALALASCNEESDSFEFSVSEYAINTAVARPSEEPLLDIANKVPAFAGYHCDSGDLVVNVAAPINASVEQALRVLISDDLASGCRSRSAPAHLPKVLFRRVKYNFLSLRTWRDRVVDDFFEVNGTNGIGISYSDNRLILTVEPAAQQNTEILVQSKSVPIDAVALVQGTKVEPQQACAASSNGPSLTGCFRPIPGGVQIGSTYSGGANPCSGSGIPYCRCTMMSANLRWMAEQSPPYWQQGYITASHCLPPMVSVYQDWMFQKDNTSGNLVAFEHVDPPGWTCGSYRCRYSDAAWAWSYGNEAQLGTIAKTQWWNGGQGACVNGHPSCMLDAASPRFYIAGARSPIEGMTVEKMGRTTGWTSGVITPGGVCNDSISLSGPKMVCQTRATYSSDGGDSGAPVFFWRTGGAGNVADIVGIHWGATSSYRTFSPWHNITLELGEIYAVWPGF